MRAIDMSRNGKAEGKGVKYETGNGELRCIPDESCYSHIQKFDCAFA